MFIDIPVFLLELCMLAGEARISWLNLPEDTTAEEKERLKDAEPAAVVLLGALTALVLEDFPLTVCRILIFFSGGNCSLKTQGFFFWEAQTRQYSFSVV